MADAAFDVFVVFDVFDVFVVSVANILFLAMKRKLSNFFATTMPLPRFLIAQSNPGVASSSSGGAEWVKGGCKDAKMHFEEKWLMPRRKLVKN